ncbi:ATP-dependent RNA helicase DEAH13 [Vitis vinifera]|uniref:RNA helicase n=1 Tax=Vitis vinifera TaxID=29760 RepID=A0A438FXZ3_VITVI|nr:ATP-dependent RNA helicase DEAH13 [Vitis vinifera]
MLAYGPAIHFYIYGPKHLTWVRLDSSNQAQLFSLKQHRPKLVLCIQLPSSTEGFSCFSSSATALPPQSSSDSRARIEMQMELSLENLEQSSGQDLWSSKGDDSNAIILPEKKGRKRKGMKQEHEKFKTNKTRKLSASQKRKLKKLEEEKEKSLLLSKSIETLEKYKIREDAFSLLQSSQNLGQVETTLEKRRRAVRFSKAGLEMPHSDRPFKSQDGEMEPDSNKIQSKQEFDESDAMWPRMVQREVLSNASISLGFTSELVCSTELAVNSRHSPTLPAKEVSEKNYDTSMQDRRNSTPTSTTADGQKNIKSKDVPDWNLNLNFRVTSNLPDCSLQPITTPTVVHVSRPTEVENNRKDLPIVMMEQEIMEAINDHTAVIICGETGCGKTTQVPQFLYEAGFGSKQASVQSGIIGVTQPRRVAVLATAKRVAFELGLSLGKEVGFQVRHDKMIGDSCSIKFMTDGILLREVQNDFSLRRYSVIILDEAHERSLNTDILIGMLSRVIQVRQKLYEEQQQMMLSGVRISPESIVPQLKLVLMSATLRVEDFISGRRLFHTPPPVIEVPSRQFPVTIHFSKRTEIVDYIGQAYKKILSIHKKLPQGGILVFVTGQREVEYLCQKLRKASRELMLNSSKQNIGNEVTAVSEMNSVGGIDIEEINEAFEIQGNSANQQTDRFSIYDEDHGDLDEDDSDSSYDSETESEWEVLGDDGNPLDLKTSEDDGNLVDILGEDRSLASLKAAFDALAGKTAINHNSKGEEKRDGENDLSAGALCVLPLYAMLPAAAQLRVFEEIKEGERLVVVATNVAETSLTIPGIKYVVDTGREKVKNYDHSNGMETYEVQWISKASAAQRAGRAGRTGPGHCYRLYSSAVFNNILPDFSMAEIMKVPVEGVILLMKSMDIDKVANFPFPTPPDAIALAEAERCLKALEALNSKGRLTPLGKAMAHYPMSPRHSRMLLTVIQIMRKAKGYARANLVLGYAVAAAAALSLPNPFVMQFEGNHTSNDGLDQVEKANTPVTDEIVDKQDKLKKKKLKETAKVSRAKFSNPSSDALTVAYALQCFELSGSPVEFCNENVMHLKTLEEMSKLRKQLLQLVFNQSTIGALHEEFSWPHGTMEDTEHAWRVSSDKHPLSLNEEELLGQAICAGWADRVAKRTRAISGSSEGDRKAKAARYQACMVKETVFLHRWSSLARSAPEFLVYSELLHTKRPYMHGVTNVKPDWLVKYAAPLCSFSAPLTDPKPYYEPLADQVFCWVIPTFGPHLWRLPLHGVPISDNAQRVSVFAYALLEGQVLPCLGSVRKYMAAPPASILRPEALGQRRVGNLLSKLKSRPKTIDSCSMLREAWRENPRELHSEILDWFQETFHKQFEVLWSQMHLEVLLDPQERFPKKKRGKRKK